MQNQQQSPTITIGEWMLTLFIAAIPIVGLVMLFVWGFGSETNTTKANFAKASLIFAAIVIILWVLVFGAIVTAILSGFSHS
ncbi:MAG: hypothetical protein PHP42_07290 [Bacteroidota bacterium]|nr:hypothetical protein [Bacteroidota bacterium]